MGILRSETCWSGHEGNSLYQQLEQGCGLRGSYVQLPATGETGIRGNCRTDRVCEPSCWIYLVHIYTRTSILLSQRGKQGDSAGAVFGQLLCVSGWSVQLALVCGAYLCSPWLLTGNVLRLAAGWTWGHTAVAASLSYTELPPLV